MVQKIKKLIKTSLYFIGTTWCTNFIPSVIDTLSTHTRASGFSIYFLNFGNFDKTCHLVYVLPVIAHIQFYTRMSMSFCVYWGRLSILLSMQRLLLFQSDRFCSLAGILLFCVRLSPYVTLKRSYSCIVYDERAGLTVYTSFHIFIYIYI